MARLALASSKARAREGGVVNAEQTALEIDARSRTSATPTSIAPVWPAGPSSRVRRSRADRPGGLRACIQGDHDLAKSALVRRRRRAGLGWSVRIARRHRRRFLGCEESRAHPSGRRLDLEGRLAPRRARAAVGRRPMNSESAPKWGASADSRAEVGSKSSGRKEKVPKRSRWSSESGRVTVDGGRDPRSTR